MPDGWLCSCVELRDDVVGVAQEHEVFMAAREARVVGIDLANHNVDGVAVDDVERLAFAARAFEAGLDVLLIEAHGFSPSSWPTPSHSGHSRVCRR